MKNMLIGAGRRWVLDLEVAHYGNPVFDLGFFLPRRALRHRWPELSRGRFEARRASRRAYVAAAGRSFAATRLP